MINESLNESLQCVSAGEPLMVFVGGLVAIVLLIIFVFGYYASIGACKGKSGYAYWLSFLVSIIILALYVIFWFVHDKLLMVILA